MKKQFLSLTLFLFTIAAGSNAQSRQGYTYSVPSAPWEESFGNHRAVLQVDQPAEVTALEFEWRRPDKDVDRKRYLIIHAETGDTVPNIKRLEVTNEHCRLLFGPVTQKGTYYFYYLPYQVQPGGGFYGRGYYPPEKAPQPEWAAQVTNRKKVRTAKITKVEARTQFDSFYPMEVTSTADERKKYTTGQQKAFYLFPEDRKYPIRMREDIPAKWLDIKQGAGFTGTAAPNEYYTFQIGLWAAARDVKQISYRASDLRCGMEVLPATAITCFNTEGVDPYGKAFRKEVNVAQGKVQALWFGVDIPQQARPGKYTGSIEIKDGSGRMSRVPVTLRIEGNVLSDWGDSEPWRHSRLRWLNSTLGLADTPTLPYTDLTLEGNRINCLGRSVEVDENSFLPAQITSWSNEMLARPMQLVIETAEGIKRLSATPMIDESTGGHVAGTWQAADDELSVTARGIMEFDGWMNYIYTLTPKKDLTVKDVRLEMAIKNEVASYFLGAGLPGQDMPQTYEGKWDAPEKTVNHFGVSLTTDKQQQWLWPFDSFWIGNAHAGIHCELRGTTYSGPLLNSYRPAYPDSWNNWGKGGFRISQGADATTVTCYSGERLLKAGNPMDYEFALLVTPVKPIDLKGQFTNRYYHNSSKPVPTDEDVKAGVRVINIHHANEYNPFINYPFLTVDKMKEFTRKWHGKGCKVKLYYTLRELTSAVTEIWAIRSLGDEILRGGNGGGFPWCREHLVTGYTPQWYQHFDHTDDTGIVADAAILTSESNSRWYNYYVEGLRWMVENMDIDGIYLDDVSYDRRILKRMRRAMESVKPGCIIDLHSNTGFSKGPANQYADFFPYIDKVWFGESFLYDKMPPANWLVESSGIPFGLTGDMLYRGGNKWLGMQYGMTVRHPWETEGVICDPRIVWKVWDDFGIADAAMLGFWEKQPAVTASDAAVKVTAYRKTGKVLLSIGNYSDEVKNVRLSFDWKQLGLEDGKVQLIAPYVEDFQPANQWGTDGEITIQPHKGWLIYVQEKE